MTAPLHEDELTITTRLVRELVDEQFPAYRSLSMNPLSQAGSTNVIYRLGEAHCVRLPRLPGGGRSLEKEARWIPALQQHLSVRLPGVTGMGRPAAGYPETWAVCDWLEGQHPVLPADGKLARALAAFIVDLRSAPAPAAPETLYHYRGDRLAACDDFTRRNIAACRLLDELDLDLSKAEQIWDLALQLPVAQNQHRWFHGDLVAENLLLESSGELVAVLDWGGVGFGDPAVDLHGAWELFDIESREIFREAVSVDQQEWLRGRAWALAIALMTFPYYWGKMPQGIEQRLEMARAVISDFEMNGV